jgi:hypothetical protein
MGGNASSPVPYNPNVYAGGFEYLADTSHTESVAVFVDQSFTLFTPCGQELKRRFGGIGWLQNQGITAGNILAMKYNGRYVYYLITNTNNYTAASQDNFAAAVSAMFAHMDANGVTLVVVENVPPKWIDQTTFASTLSGILGDTYVFYS